MGPKIYGFVILGPRFCDSACSSGQSQGIDQGLFPNCSMRSGAGLLYFLCFSVASLAGRQVMLSMYLGDAIVLRLSVLNRTFCKPYSTESVFFV